jgi:hypothetical protein
VSSKNALAVLAVIALSFSAGACKTEIVCRPTPEPVGELATRSADLVTAYDELVTAARATPHWKVAPIIPHGVAGRAAIADDKADALRPFTLTGEVSPATVELAKIQITWVSALGGEPETRRRHPSLTGAQAQRYHDEEVAYYHVAECLPWLELYVTDGIRWSWIEEEMIARLADDARTISGIDSLTLCFWRRDLDERAEIHHAFHEMRVRIGMWLARYEAMIQDREVTAAR